MPYSSHPHPLTAEPVFRLASLSFEYQRSASRRVALPPPARRTAHSSNSKFQSPQPIAPGPAPPPSARLNPLRVASTATHRHPARLHQTQCTHTRPFCSPRYATPRRALQRAHSPASHPRPTRCPPSLPRSFDPPLSPSPPPRSYPYLPTAPPPPPALPLRTHRRPTHTLAESTTHPSIPSTHRSTDPSIHPRKTKE